MNRKKIVTAFVSAMILGFVACSSTVIVDPSVSAFASDDYTLVGSACQAVPGGGVDSCLVTSGTTMSSAWTLVVPKPKDAAGVTGGTVDVYYKDLHKSYAVTDWTLQISWADFFSATVWDSSMDGEVMALLTLNWTDNAGINQVLSARGLAVVVVTPPGYSRIPIDSGQQAWGTTCKVQYSTAGRSAVSCQ